VRGEFAKLSRVQIRDSPEIHPVPRPVKKVVTAPRARSRIGVIARRSGFDEEINGMFVPPINERDHSAAMEIIEASALERKASRRQVAHFRREVDLSVKPGLDCVLVGRNHIHQMRREERANVIGDQLVSKCIAGGTRVLKKGEGKDQKGASRAGDKQKPGRQEGTYRPGFTS